jgi:heme/copper-type cytochrome/quinol oxidase subunit 3
VTQAVITATEHHGEAHEEVTTTGLTHKKLLMWAFLGSECMFFGSLIATYLVYRNQSKVGPWPEEIIDVPLTTVSTFVLLMSSLAMVLALNYTQRNRPGLARFWILMTAALGTGFLTFQAFEFTEFYHEGLTPRTNLFGTTFFVLTGFHGAHVTIGVIWLLMMAGVTTPRGMPALSLLGMLLGFFAGVTGVLGMLDVIPDLHNAGGPIFISVGAIVLVLSGLRHFTLKTTMAVDHQRDNLEITGLYWHFVDIVWIVIFTVVYLVSANDNEALAESLLHG